MRYDATREDVILLPEHMRHEPEAVMKSTKITHIVIYLFTAVFLSSCYTQLDKVERRGYNGYYTSTTTPRTAPDRRAPVEERVDEIENVEDYELGYEDGWVDAEDYYFVDEETRDWYLEHGASLAYTKNRPYRASHWRSYSSDWYYSPYHYYTYYGVPHWKYGFSINFSWGRPWGGWGYYTYYNPYHWGGYYDYWGYYRYPFYTPYYGGYWGGWYGYYNRPVVIYNNYAVTNRTFSPRSTGLASTRRSTVNRSRPDVSSSRSAIRADARNSRINSRTGSLNRSTSRSAVRSRGSSTRGSSSVGRSSSGRSNSRGTVNRSRSTNRSSGSVGRTRGSNRSSGSSVGRSSSRSNNSSVNRSRSSNRSSGSSVGRSSSRSSGNSSSASRSRSNNRQAAAIQSSSRSDVRSDVRSSIISGRGNSAIISRGEISNRDNSNRTIRTQNSSRAYESISGRQSVLNRLQSSSERTSRFSAEQLRPVASPARSMTRMSREPARSGSSSFGRALLRGAGKAASSILREAAGSRSSRSSSVGRSSSGRSSGSSAVRSSKSSSRSSGVSRSSGRSNSSRGTSSSSRSRSSSRNN